jgi:hypothetical protein
MVDGCGAVSTDRQVIIFLFSESNMQHLWRWWLLWQWWDRSDDGGSSTSRDIVRALVLVIR